MDAYNQLYDESITNPESFWEKQAKEFLHWDREFDQVLTGTFEDGDITWFNGGKVSVRGLFVCSVI